MKIYLSAHGHESAVSESRRYDRYLPDPFLKEDGSRITQPSEWPAQADRIRQLASENMYGTWAEE